MSNLKEVKDGSISVQMPKYQTIVNASPTIKVGGVTVPVMAGGGGSGALPKFSAKANTLPAGSEATATVEGTLAEPIIVIGVPAGKDGDVGKTPVITINAKSIPNGEQPTVEKGGTDEEPTFLFGIPLAKDGKDGVTPSISLKVNAIEYGQSPTVDKTGTDAAPVFTIGFPKAKDGDKGDKGNDGVTPVITANAVTVAPETPAEVEVSGDPATPLFTFKIPQGKQGAGITVLGSYDTLEELKQEHPTGNVGDAYVVGLNLYTWSESKQTWVDLGKFRGETPQITVKVTKLPAGSEPTVTQTGTTENPIITIGIPEGQKGDKGDKGETGTTEWNGITGKPNTFPPSSHTHTIENIDGLQTALNSFATSDELTQGLAEKAPTSHTHTIENVTGLQDELDSKQPAGDYATNTALTEGLADKLGKLEKAESSKTADSVLWKNVGEKPSTFAPAPHTHETSQITGLDVALSGKAPLSHTHTKDQITDFAHNHEISEVNGLETALAGKAPTSHTHTIANVTGLDSALANKAPLSHTHTIENVTGLQDALDGKQPAGDYALNSAIADMLTKTEAGSTYATLANTYTKQEVDQKLGTVLKFKGIVESSSDLPESGSVGDMYIAKDTSAEWFWNGTKWEYVGGTIDLSYLLSKEDAAQLYATKTELSQKLGKTEKAVSAGTADTATKATQDASGNVITTTYATITALNEKLGKTEKAESSKTADSVLWTNVQNKPEDFPPSSHTHATSQITGLDTALAGKAPVSHTHTKSQITDFAHTHAISEITDLQDSLDGKAPISHTHEIAQVNGLSTALSGKAPTSHTHAIANVTGLQTALDSKVESSVYTEKISALEKRLKALEDAGFITMEDLPETADFVD